MSADYVPPGWLGWHSFQCFFSAGRVGRDAHSAEYGGERGRRGGSLGVGGGDEGLVGHGGADVGTLFFAGVEFDGFGLGVFIRDGA